MSLTSTLSPPLSSPASTLTGSPPSGVRPPSLCLLPPTPPRYHRGHHLELEPGNMSARRAAIAVGIDPDVVVAAGVGQLVARYADGPTGAENMMENLAALCLIR